MTVGIAGDVASTLTKVRLGLDLACSGTAGAAGTSVASFPQGTTYIFFSPTSALNPAYICLSTDDGITYKALKEWQSGVAALEVVAAPVFGTLPTNKPVANMPLTLTFTSNARSSMVCVMLQTVSDCSQTVGAASTEVETPDPP